MNEYGTNPARPGQLILPSLGESANKPPLASPLWPELLRGLLYPAAPPPAFFSLSRVEWLVASRAPHPGRLGRTGCGATVLWWARTPGQKTSCPGLCQSGTLCLWETECIRRTRKAPSVSPCCWSTIL